MTLFKERLPQLDEISLFWLFIIVNGVLLSEIYVIVLTVYINVKIVEL